jgi:signal transduction histidine kinase
MTATMLTTGDPRADADVLRAEVLAQGVERAVADRAAASAPGVADFETFGRAVAHELRAPLRAIDGFADALVDEYGVALPPEGRRYAEVIRDNARQMSRLVDGLLRLARLDHRPIVARPIEAGLVAELALGQVAQEDEAGAACVRIEPLPPCIADPALLELVFVNLIGNAVKFTRGVRAPMISVSARVEDGEIVYRVRDNGVGFDRADADRLFRPFERLHSDEQFRGTGLGLALARRVVERHGGRIWADGTPGCGATFWFTLEPRPADAAARH